MPEYKIVIVWLGRNTDWLRYAVATKERKVTHKQLRGSSVARQQRWLHAVENPPEFMIGLIGLPQPRKFTLISG